MNDNVEATLSISVTVIYYALACMMLFMFVRFFTASSTSTARRTEEKQSVAQLQRGVDSPTEEEITANREQVFSTILSLNPGIAVTVDAVPIPETVRTAAINDGDPNAVREIKSKITQSRYRKETKYNENGVASVAFIHTP